MTPYAHHTDPELIVALTRSDRHAFEEIYNRYQKPVYRYVIGLVKTTEAAEDLTHEIFLKLWEFRERLDIRTNFASYLFRAAHNKVIDETRKAAHDRRLRAALLYKYEELHSTQNESIHTLNYHDKLIEQALDSLSPQRRKVYELCRLQGKSYKEAAAELDISTNTVKEHLSKAMASLRFFLRNREELTLLILLFRNIF